LPSQTVFDFLSQRHNRLCHFISDIMDYFLAGDDQQQTNQPDDLSGGKPLCCNYLVTILGRPFMVEDSIVGEGPMICDLHFSQTVFDFLSQRHNRLCHFISDIMDYFLAGKDQQQTNQPNDLAGV